MKQKYLYQNSEIIYFFQTKLLAVLLNYLPFSRIKSFKSLEGSPLSVLMNCIETAIKQNIWLDFT